MTNVFVSRSSKFPLSHVTSNYEPLHKRNTGICILTKTILVIKPFKVYSKIRWSNLNCNLRKTHQGRSSLFMMRTKGLPSRQPPPCVSAELIISLCYQEVSVSLARAFIPPYLYWHQNWTLWSWTFLMRACFSFRIYASKGLLHLKRLLNFPRSQGSRSDFPRRYDHRNHPSLMVGLFPIIKEEEKHFVKAAATSSRDQVVVHRRWAGQDPGATGQAAPLQQLQQ